MHSRRRAQAEVQKSTQGRSEAGITALVAQANRKSRVKGNSKDRAKKSAADEAVEAAGKELHLRHVLWQQGKRRKATPVEIAAAGPVIDVDELDEVVEELDMLESPMRTRKIPQKLLNWLTLRVHLYSAARLSASLSVSLPLQPSALVVEQTPTKIQQPFIQIEKTNSPTSLSMLL